MDEFFNASNELFLCCMHEQYQVALVCGGKCTRLLYFFGWMLLNSGTLRFSETIREVKKARR